MAVYAGDYNPAAMLLPQDITIIVIELRQFRAISLTLEAANPLSSNTMTQQNDKNKRVITLYKFGNISYGGSIPSDHKVQVAG